MSLKWTTDVKILSCMKRREFLFFDFSLRSLSCYKRLCVCMRVRVCVCVCNKYQGIKEVDKIKFRKRSDFCKKNRTRLRIKPFKNVFSIIFINPSEQGPNVPEHRLWCVPFNFTNRIVPNSTSAQGKKLRPIFFHL